MALAGYMHRDLVENRRWVTEEEYALSLTLAQVMPGPMAAQLAIALGYFKHGLLGATLSAIAFILPSFLIVVAISILYLAYTGLWWMQALFYGIGAAVIAIIAIAAYKLARSTNKRDPLQWAIFGVLAAVTILSQAELAWLFLLAGFFTLIVRTPPQWITKKFRLRAVTVLSFSFSPVALPMAGPVTEKLISIFLFFLKSSFFVFGSGLAIVPFLYKGVVQQFGWLNETQFLDAVAVALITPGPVVITVAFIGYLVARLPGAILAATGIFLPVYLLTVVPAPWMSRHRDNPQLRSFVQGATAAATGAITGAVVILGERAIVDLPTSCIALASFLLLWSVKLPEPIIILLSGMIGVLLRVSAI